MSQFEYFEHFNGLYYYYCCCLLLLLLLLFFYLGRFVPEERKINKEN